MKSADKLCAGNRVIERKAGSVARRRYQRGSLKQVGGFWEGRWREYVIVNGSEVSQPKKKQLFLISEFPTGKLAQREFDRTILNVVNDEATKPHQVCTFADFVKKWESSVMSQFKPSAQRSMGCEINKHLVPFFGKMPLTEVSGEDVQRFIASRTQSPKYTKNLIADAKTIWRSAIEWGYVTHNPFMAVRLPKVQKKQAPAFTLDEVQRIMANANEPFRTMYWVAAALGPRGGEIVGLRVRDINLKALQISIVQSVWNGKLQSPKTGNGVRTFSISPRLADHLRGEVEGKKPDDTVFVKPDGTLYRQAGVQRYNLKALLKKLRIQCTVEVNKGKEVVTVNKGVGLHSFRHANATFMDQLNAPAAVRMARIGHGDLSTTMGYTHLVSADDRRVAAGIDDMLATVVVQ